MTGRKPELRQYIVLPSYGFTSALLAQSQRLRTSPGLIRLEARPGREAKSATSVHLIHSMREDGPKLVEMSDEAELNLRQQEPGVKVIPLITYAKMRAEPAVGKQATATGTSGGTVKVVDSIKKKPVAGAKIVAFTSYRYREGAEAVTAKNGVAKLGLADGTKVERLYVFPPAMHWGYYTASLHLPLAGDIELEPMDLAKNRLLLGEFCKSIPATGGSGVVVGIIDSGIAKNHPALSIAGGANMVTEELLGAPGSDVEWGPAEVDGEHGTHVAGIVAMRATATVPVRGVAPGASLRSYRVFANSGADATNYDVMKAIERAVRDGCHIVNLSLGGGVPDEGVRAAIGFALDQGVLPIVAAGNSGRGPVAYPAAWPGSVAVSAMGQKGTFPTHSDQRADIAAPYGRTNSDYFVGAFSNYGPQISLTGPGVGVVSTLPDDTYGAMSGTSMASPAIAGFAAFLLASRPDILTSKGAERAKLLRQELMTKAQALGFGRDYEGFGMPTS